MSFPRYPKYKHSGAEWLGQVPEHWEVKRIGYYFSERRDKVSDRDFPALSVTKNGIVPQLETAAKTDDGDNRKKVLKGDFVINSRSDRKGSAGASELDGSVSLICTVLHPQEDMHTPFVHHLLRCQPFQEEYYRNGKGIVADLWSTSYSEMRNILLGTPPLPEQTAIATFLDSETEKIDALVAEQRRLIELLKEKRQAVIFHAVTKGLNPNTPMKPSGIEWLGDVPARWKTLRLKNISPRISGRLVYQPAQYFATKGVPFLMGNNVTETGITWEYVKFIPEKINSTFSQHALREGDVITVRVGAPGVTCVVPREADGLNCGSLMIIRKSAQFDSDWLSNVMNSPVVRIQIDRVQYGAAQEQINIGDAVNFVIPAPPLNEQHSIVRYLTDQTTKFDALTTEAQRAIELLQERRTALISAAVTGQIDVRNQTETPPNRTEAKRRPGQIDVRNAPAT